MKYYLNLEKQTEEDGSNYEIHDEKCHKLPKINIAPLGEHTNCHTAKEKAQKEFPELADKIDGCKICCNECHIR